MKRTAVGLSALFTLSLLAMAQEIPPDMKTYQMVFLRLGPNGHKNESSPDAEKVQAEHLARLAKLNHERVNLLYGPFLDEGDLRGIAVLDVPDAAAAQKIFADDAHVKAGNLVVEIAPWLGPKDFFSLPSDPPTPEQFVLGFLVRGTHRDQPEKEAEEIQKGHLAYLKSLHDQGKLALAGPFMDDSPRRGIVLYRVATVEEAQQLASGDPAVKAGRLALEARPWMTFKGILK